jgi:ketosteroid isomerase-like protein
MTLSYVDAKGAKVDFLGKYTVVWKREAAGEWKVALDMSNPDAKEDVRYNQ